VFSLNLPAEAGSHFLPAIQIRARRISLCLWTINTYGDISICGRSIIWRYLVNVQIKMSVCMP